LSPAFVLNGIGCCVAHVSCIATGIFMKGRVEKIPSKQNANLYIKLDNGKYEITVRQLFDPAAYEDEEKVNFEIVIEPDIKKEVQRVDKVFWQAQ